MSDLTYPEAIALAAFFLSLGIWWGCGAIADSITSFGESLQRGLEDINLGVSITLYDGDKTED